MEIELAKTNQIDEILAEIKQCYNNIAAIDNAMVNEMTTKGEIGEDLITQQDHQINAINQNLAILYNVKSKLADEEDTLRKMKSTIDGNLKLIADKKEILKNAILDSFPDGIKTDSYNFYITNIQSIEVEEGLNIDKLEKTYPDLVRVKKEVDKNAIKVMYKSKKALPEGIKIKYSTTLNYKSKGE